MGTAFEQALNKDCNGVPTPAVYDPVSGQWLGLSGNYAKTAGGLWVPQKCAADGTILAQLTGSYLPYAYNIFNALPVLAGQNSALVKVDNGQGYKTLGWRFINNPLSASANLIVWPPDMTTDPLAAALDSDPYYNSGPHTNTNSAGNVIDVSGLPCFWVQIFNASEGLQTTLDIYLGR